MRPRLLVLLLSLIALNLTAQDLAGFEKILIPVYGSTSGANGAAFDSRLSIYSEASFELYPSAAGDASNGISVIAPGFPISLPPLTGMPPRVLFVRAPAPLFANLYVLSTDAAGVFRDQRTAIPVVRADDFRTGRTFIPGVPVTWVYDPPDGVQRQAIPQLRHMLRVYDVDAIGGKQVRVRIFSEANPSLPVVREFTVALGRRDGSTPADPWYAQIPIDPVCIPFSAHTPCVNASIRFEIEPLDSFRYWAMVSTTDNVTQHVTVFSF